MLIPSLFISIISLILIIAFLFSKRFRAIIGSKFPSIVNNAAETLLVLGISIIPVFNIIFVIFMLLLGLIIFLSYKADKITEEFKGNKWKN